MQVHFRRDVLLFPPPSSRSSVAGEEDHRQAPRTPLAAATRSREGLSAMPLAQGVKCPGFWAGAPRAMWGGISESRPPAGPGHD